MNKFCPQTAAKTFAVSSVFILLKWLLLMGGSGGSSGAGHWQAGSKGALPQRPDRRLQEWKLAPQSAQKEEVPTASAAASIPTAE